jgi:hypothetical protein
MTYNSELTENGANQATDTYSTDDSYIGKETAGSGETIISFHTWDQSDYIYRNDGTQSNIYSYNRYTPCTPNNYTVAGSIPIAACQLIYYWGCLQNTLGADVTVDSIEFSSEDYYTTDTLGFYVADNLFCCFQTMANTLTDINYNFDVQEIAALSFGIGVKLQADYGYNINDTTANISDVDDVLRGLGFTAQCVTDYKAGLLNKTGFDLESELQENIGKDQPVIVELKDSNLGLSHAAIIDGYNSRTGEYHFNMGLGGNYDGWYALDDLPYGDDIITGIVYNVTLPTDTDTEFADGDFNGDGKSDILFSNGTSIGYYASGQSSAWTPLGDFAAGWEIAGNADFDGDNKSDILFCNGTSTGFYSGGSSASWTQTGDISSGWDVVDCSDFDGSGKDDILCSDGTSIGYYADGTNAWTSLGTYSSGWDIVETGDFNGDDSDDILFSNGTSIGYYGAGQSSNWTDLGTYASGAGWDIVDVGDFNDDTVDDILFSNGSSIGYYGGGHSTNWTYLGDYASGAGWDIAGIGDFDGDGSDDILFSNSNSYSIGYYGSGLPSNWTDLGTYSSAWEIVVA